MEEILNYKIFKTATYFLTVEMVFFAIIIAIIAKFVVLLLSRLVARNAKKNPENAERHFSIYQLVRYIIWIITIGFMLESIGIKVTFLLAGSAALLVGLGLGIQQTFNDIISGIIILVEGSLKKNDVVEVSGLIGRVIEIKLRTSVVYTRDGIYIIVPNHKFINENVINWSHNSKATRFKIEVGVAYNSDENLVKKILYECLNEQDDVIKDETTYRISVRIINFGDNSIDFEMLFWSKDIFYIERTKSEIRFKILKKFREHNISIPFPQRDIHIINK